MNNEIANANLFTALGVPSPIASMLAVQPNINNPAPPPPQPEPQTPTHRGNWLTVNNYKEATMASASVDGTPTMCISPQENKIYFVQMNSDGKKFVSPYKLIPDTDNQSSAPQPQQVQTQQPQQKPLSGMEKLEAMLNNLSNRLASVEKFSNDMQAMLRETSDESTSKNI